MKCRIVEADVAEVKPGIAFIVNGAKGIFMVTSKPEAGTRDCLNLEDGAITRIPCTAKITAYPDAELIIRDKS